jgi:hypothetical protein
LAEQEISIIGYLMGPPDDPPLRANLKFTLTEAGNVLKEVYLPKIREQLNRESSLLKLLEK